MPTLKKPLKLDLKLHFGTPVDFFCESIHIIGKIPPPSPLLKTKQNKSKQNISFCFCLGKHLAYKIQQQNLPWGAVFVKSWQNFKKYLLFASLELTQLYFKLFPSVCLAQLRVLVCLKQAVPLVQEKLAVSRFLPPSGWQPSQNVPAGGRQEGKKRQERKKRKFLISSTKDWTLVFYKRLNIRTKILQGLMEGRESPISWRSWRWPELIIMKIILRNTYDGFLVGMTAALWYFSAFHLHQILLLFSCATLISWLQKTFIRQRRKETSRSHKQIL